MLYTDKTTYAQKIKNDFEWIKRKVDSYDKFNNTAFFSERTEKFKVNYDLYNGRMDFNTYVQSAEGYGTMGLTAEINFEQDEYIHFPIIQQILNDLEGEEIKRPFKLRVVSTNVNSESARNNKRKELLTDYVVSEVQKNLMETLKTKQQGYLAKQIASLQGLPQEEYYQAYTEMMQKQEQELKQQVDALTPSEISTYMAKGFQLPEEQLANEILQYHIRHSRLKNIFDRGWQDVIITGEEIYRTTIINGQPVIQVINPIYFNYSKNKQINYLDESDWCSYTEYMSVYDLHTRFDLTNKESDLLTETNGKIVDNIAPWDLIASMVITPLNVEPNEQDNLHISTRRYRTTHFVFKTLKKIKYVSRMDDITGRPEKYIVDETYKFNKLIDLDIEELWIPEYWECTKICTSEPIYKNIRPLEHQFRNPNDPFDIRNCYTGVVYSARNSLPVSICDLGKPWQFIYNVVLNQVIELIKSNPGKIMLANIGQIPSKHDPLQWMQYVKKYKIALIETSREGTAMGGVDPQYWKSIDLTNAAEIQEKLNLLEYIEKKIAQSMSYNPSRLGVSSPYETASANQQNITQSFNQTEKWFNLHQIVKERTTENFLEICKSAYKDSPLITSYLLSDMAVATLNTEVADLANHYFRVFASNSQADTEMVQTLKGMIQPIIQNSNGDLRVAAEVLTAETATEIKNIIHRIEEQKEASQQAQAQQEQQAKQMELQKLQDIEAMKHQNQLEVEHLKGEYGLKEAEINSQRFAIAKDIDGDKINDDIEIAKIKMAAEHEKNMHEIKETQLKHEVKNAKTKIKK